MKIPTQELKDTFAIVDKVDSHAGLLASQYIRLMFDKKLTMAISGHVIAEATQATDGSLQGTFFADRRVFGAFLGNAKSKEVDLSIKDGQMIMTGGKQKVLVSGVEEVQGYSSWQAPKKAKSITITPELKKDFGLCNQYAPITAAADHLSAVYLLEGYGILATDSFNVAVCLDSTVTSTAPLPVSLTKLLSSLAVEEVITDANGAGVKLHKGYLYQPLSSNLGKYPLDSVKKLVSANQKQTSVASFLAKDLSAGLAYLKRFVFGSGDEALVEVTCPAGSVEALFTLTMAQGAANRRVPLEGKVTEALALKWTLLSIWPWVEYLSGLDPELEISCTQSGGIHGLRTAIEDKAYLLMMADKG